MALNWSVLVKNMLWLRRPPNALPRQHHKSMALALALCINRCRLFLLVPALSEGMAGMSQRGLAERQCKARLLYPHVKWGRGRRPVGGCMETFTARKATLFCPRCSQQIYRRRAKGDYGIEHVENLHNLPPITIIRLIRRPTIAYTSGDLQRMSGNRLAGAINSILDGRADLT